MSRTYVALDLETTGLNPEADAITEVAAVRFTGDGAMGDSYATLVNPGRPIPPVVQEITGIRDTDVAQAPMVGEIADALRAFVAGATIVGHNVGFDLAFLRRAGLPFDTPAIDTAELSRVLMPDKSPRGLMELAAALGTLAEEHHRALPDARTAARVFLALQERAEGIGPALRIQLARLVSLDNLTLAEVIAGEGWESIPPAERGGPGVRPSPSFPALVKLEPRSPVLPSETRRVFARGSGALSGFEERPEQLAVAETVTGALSNGGHWLIEAGTGVGKSLAYLIPAALFALRNGERVVVSTNTLNLQEQLLRKDIPAVRKMLQDAGIIEEAEDLRVAVLKGRSNYLCLRRWTASYGASLADPDFNRLAASLLLWLPETETGDRSELNLGNAAWQSWQRFSAQDTDCLARPNAYVKEGLCFLQRARKAAESAHIVIVNHALLLADIASGGSALPPFDHLVVDEAHNLEDQATQQFGGSVSRRLMMDALDGLHRRGGREQREG
ncbi:MAG TPA: exonuclease domain-containing protein, partial [Tepidiformaceae bacterium]|nr:exonuclease domain-containing protein [Tepidiformaceae bacterium]